MSMQNGRVTFAAQIRVEILSALRGLAQSGARPIDALVEEALADWLAKHRRGDPRAAVMGGQPDRLMIDATHFKAHVTAASL